MNSNNTLGGREMAGTVILVIVGKTAKPREVRYLGEGDRTGYWEPEGKTPRVADPQVVQPCLPSARRHLFGKLASLLNAVGA